MFKKGYAAPCISTVGSLHDSTLVHNKYATLTPDGVVFHPPSGPPIALSS